MTKHAGGRPRKEFSKTTTPPAHVSYYTISEAAALLGVHRHTLQARLRAGTLKGKLIGRTWRIYRDELFDNSGFLYVFDCMDGVLGDKHLTPADVNQLQNGKAEPLTEGELITIARNYEASLYRCKDNSDTGLCVYECI